VEVLINYFYKDGSTVYLSQNNFNSLPTIAIRVRKSTDNGATWTSLGDAVSFNPGSSTSCPNFNRPAKIHNHITAQGSNIAVSFIKPNGSYCNVGIAYSTNGGSTFNGSDIAYLYVMWQEKVGSQWATTFSTPGRVSDRNYNFNQNPAGHDLFAIWANDYYGDDAGAVYFTRTSYTSVEEMVKGIYTVDGKLVKGNLNELPREIEG
jgi:hypothetical protein